MIRAVFSSFKTFLMRCICCLIVLVSCAGLFYGKLTDTYNGGDNVYLASTNSSCESIVCTKKSLIEIIKDFFGVKPKKQETTPKTMVYLGGNPLGFTMSCDGVIVVAIGSVQTLFGEVSPCENKNIKVGDVISSVNGEKLTSSHDVERILNSSSEQYSKLEIVRGEEKIEETVMPAREATSLTLRLGLWIRDNAAGVGTLTYIREDNLRFGALGHPVSDIDTNTTLPVSSGNVYKCNIVGVTKGSRGTPGELRGLFLKTGEEAGNLDSNNEFGVYGTMKQQYLEKNNITRKIEVGSRDMVKTGKAKIVCTIDGCTPEEFDIEIVKLSYQASQNKKSMVIKVTDPRLINETGGIVQGMSGSPIIQNDKLVGAVTHVFVSDATKGFGVYIDWMIDN